MVTILLIEDDDRIRDALCRVLSARGHAVVEASSGLVGLQRAVDDRPDVVVLDLGLPDIDGRDLLKMLRSVSPVPIIVSTARDDESEIVATLDAGADDYLVKPYSAEQLDARVRAVLRRGQVPDAETAGPLGVGRLALDPTTRVASLDGTALELSRKEFDMLYYLASRSGTVVTKRELLTEVWNQPFGGGERTIDVHLSWLRRKLGETATDPRYLLTVRGVGIRLVNPDEG